MTRFSLGESARVKLADRHTTEIRVGELAATLFPMSPSQREEYWANVIGEFVARQRGAGVSGAEIARVCDSLAQLTAAALVALERNSQDANR